eukprot:5985177-Alexandrium_andersonii.AAC.1
MRSSRATNHTPRPASANCRQPPMTCPDRTRDNHGRSTSASAAPFKQSGTSSNSARPANQSSQE